jgi:ADP-ribose pyrophosphatase
MFDDGRILLERQFRYPHGRDFIELPAGKLEPGEPHLETAKRELLEETGYAASEWRRLCVIHTAIAYTDEAIEIYLARKLEKRAAASLDQGEFLETVAVDFQEALAMVRDGRITDSKSVAGLLWYATWGASQASG